MPTWFRALGWLAACGIAPAWAIDASDIKPRPGLIITNTVFASIVSSGGNFGYMDTEDLFKLETVAPEGLTYQIKMSAPGNQRVEEIARRLKWPRKVRHDDLEESARMTLFYASADPEMYAGQTFAETSRKVLTALKTGGETPFVFGPYVGVQVDASALATLASSGNADPGFQSARTRPESHRDDVG